MTKLGTSTPEKSKETVLDVGALPYPPPTKEYGTYPQNEAPSGSVRYRPRVSKRTSDLVMCIGIVLIIVLVVSTCAVTGILINSYIKSCNNNTDTEKPMSAFSANAPDYTFDDIFNSSLRPRGFSASWLPGGNTYRRRNADGDLVEVDAETGDSTIIVPNSVFEAAGTGTYYVSPDARYVLFAQNRKGVWRYSYTAVYVIYDTQDEGPEPTFITFPNDDAMRGQVLQLARWSAQDHAVGFVYENNLYYQMDPLSAPVQVTTSGQNNIIFNGMCDWVYEEDVLGNPVAHYWAPNDGHIVFAEFDDTDVPMIKFPWYGPKTDMYGDIVEIAYAKPGQLGEDGTSPGPNTKARLFMLDTSNPSNQPQEITPPEVFQDIDHYFTRVTWRDNNHVYIVWTNRVQNQAIAVLCNANTLNCQVNHERLVEGGWIDAPYASPWFIDGGESFLTVLPKAEGSDGMWRHVALVSADSGAEGVITFLTDGLQEVRSVIGYDESRSVVYFTATNGDPTESHIFRVGTPAADAGDEPMICVTCDFPDTCRYVSGSFSSTGKYYLQNCLGPDIQSYRLRGVEDEKDDLMEDNAEVRALLAQKALPTREFINIPIGGGYETKAEVFYPPNFNPDSAYKMIIYTYAGPGSSRVFKTFPVGSNTNNWLRYLASVHNVVVVSLDGRGGAGRGEDFRFEVYRRLATYEVQDQILGARYFRDQSFIDSNARSAIFGWSYGGLASSTALGDASDDLTCAIAVAPVTNFLYYDTAYTERYMALATPDDNAAGYDDTDVMSKVENFKGKKYFLAHGSADDNVHYQQAAQLISALTAAEVQHRQMMYVDEDHGIGGRSRHLYQAFTDFLLQDCWPEGTDPVKK